MPEHKTCKMPIKDFYARPFQEWSLGKNDGTAEGVFDVMPLPVVCTENPIRVDEVTESRKLA
jgi:hypothetical protein